MSIEELLRSEMDLAAARLDAPHPQLDGVMARGRRRRGLRLAAMVGSGMACAAVVMVVTASVAGLGAPATPVAAPPATPAPATGSVTGGVVGTVEGSLVVDGDGFSVRPRGGGAQRILEAHTLQLGGRPSFGPAVSDGAGGFVYSVVEIDGTSKASSGQVLWVPAGATTPRVVAVESSVGVGEVIGVVEGGAGPEAVYTTAAGRTVATRIAPLEGGGARTLVEGVHAEGASGRHIVGTSHTGGCVQLRLFTTTGAERSLPAPDGPCRDIRNPVLSPQGGRAAYLDHRRGEATLNVVDTASGRTEWQWTVGEGRLVGLGDDYAYLDGERRVTLATGVMESNSPPPADVFQINDRLVLQTPGGNAFSYEDAVAAAPAESSESSDIGGGAGAGWQVVVRAQSADPPVDLDVFGVTATGLGPYLLGARTQTVADAAGHDLVAPSTPLDYCDTAAPGRAAGVSRRDLTLTVVNDRMVRFDFATPRFTFDGLGVGSTAADISQRYPDADTHLSDARYDRRQVTVAPVGDNDIEVVFELVGDTVTRYRVGMTRYLQSVVPCG